MSDLRVIPIDPDRLDAMRGRGADEYGNPWLRRVAEGWEPLRCCLRIAGAGEGTALICYSAWTAPSPWAEAGPVFVHHERCPGYLTPGEYPPALRGGRRQLRPYDESGAIAYDHITFIEPDDDPAEVVHSVLTRPGVAAVHVRSATAGCLAFEVRLAR